MSKKESYRICLVGECLSTGGAEKSMALLSQFFTAKGIAVHTIIVVDNISYSYAGTLLNLGTYKNSSNGIANKIKRFRILKTCFRQQQFDYIIDFRIRISFLQEFLISRLLYNSNTIYTVHSSMSDLYVPKSKWQAKLIYQKAQIVAVSHGIEAIVRNESGLDNIKTIHNPIDIDAIKKLSGNYLTMDSKFILAAGRMDSDVKQFDRLIVAYSKSKLPERNVKLVILGDGNRRGELEKIISKLHLKEQVVLQGHVENPYQYMKNALFFVLSSKREGLPTVILESLASGTPVLSFDCVSGPSEMIVDKQNAILVADQDFEKLTEALNQFVEDEKLYSHCKSNALASVNAFSLENIGKQWLEFLKIDVS